MKRTKEVRENEINEEQEGQCSEEIKANSELPEEYYHGLEDLPWNLSSLEQLLYISLPEWIQRALLCNLAEQFGVWTFHNNFLPCRLISYTLLPYTLPATALISVIYRLLCWMKTLVQQALNAGWEFEQEAIVHLRFALTNLRRLLLNRFLPFLPTLQPWLHLPLSLPCFPLLSPALRFLSHRLTTSTSKTQLERRSQSQPVCLCFQLTGSSAFCRNIDNITTKTLHLTFLLQLSLEIEIENHPGTLKLQKNILDHEGRLVQDWSTEVDENLSGPFISYMDVQEEE